MKGSDFIFDCINLLLYKFNIINRKHDGWSYIDSPDWIRNNKSNNRSCQLWWWLRCNSHIKSWRNRKKFAKNIKILSLLEINVTGKDWINHQENMTWKKIQKNNPAIALLLTKKKQIHILSTFHKTQLSWKPNHSFNDSKWIRST